MTATTSQNASDRVNGPTSMARAIANTLKGSLGNLVEWYDVYAYTVFLTYFESHFFDPADKNSTVYAYAVFAITFVMRPVGSWFFGRFADRHGRRAALTFSVSLMAAASLVIGILPTRETIGVWAAVFLILMRLIQGFATGGEYGASATYMSEAATADRRGFFSSFQYVTLVGGHVLAQLTLLIMTAVMPAEEITAWGWRVPFFIGGVMAVVVFWLRRTMDESLSEEHLAAVREGRDKSSGSMLEMMRRYWKPLLIVFLITMGGTICFYTYSVNGPAMVKSTFKDDPMTAAMINFFGLVFLMLLQPLGGLLSDKFGRKPVFLFFCFGALAYTYFLVTYLPQMTNAWAAFGMQALAYIILTGYTSINAIVKAEMFPAHVRGLGVGFGYAMANSVFGGTAPLLYTAAKDADAVPTFIVYVLVCVAITTATIFMFVKNRGTTHLDEEQGHAYADYHARRAGGGAAGGGTTR